MFVKLNLQYFSNDEEFGAYEPEPIDTGDNPLTGIETAPGTSQEQPQEISQEELDFGGRKVKVTDPQFHDLHKDYSELNRTYQQTNQQLQMLQQQNQMFQQMMEQGQFGGQQQQQQAEPTPQDVQARLAEINDEYMEKFYDNAIEAEKWRMSQPEYQQFIAEQYRPIIEQYIKPLQEFVQPMQQEQKWQNEIRQISEKYSDFEQYTDHMQELLQEAPHMAEMPNALETMYFVAKGRAAQNVPSPEQMLSDPNFQQQIMQNEQIRNQIVNQYVGGKQQQYQNTPNMMGSQMGQAPSIPEEMPTSISQGSKMFRKYLGQ